MAKRNNPQPVVVVDENNDEITAANPLDVSAVAAAGDSVIGRVKITDGTDVALVTASGSLNVNIAEGGAGDGAILDGVTSSIKATVADLTNSNPLAVEIVDGDGTQITSFGGGTQYTEGDTDASITGTALLFEGAADTLVAATGTAANGLDVDVTRVTGTVTVDGSGVTQPVSHAALTELAAAIDTEVQVDVVGPLPAGTNAIGKLAANSGVDIGDTDVTSVIPGTGATNLGKAVDSVPGATDTGVAALVVRDDALAALTPVDGDYTNLRVDSTGALWVKQSGTVTVDTELGTAISPDDAVASSISGPPVTSMPQLFNGAGTYVRWYSGAYPDANNGNGAAAVILYNYNGSTFDRVRGDTSNGLDVDVTRMAALVAGTAAIGKLLPPDIDVTAHTNYAKKYYTNAGAVTDGIVWSPAAGKRWHIGFMSINVSAACTVTLEDDLGGGDSVVWKAELAANSGIVVPFPEKYPLASGEDAADLLVTTTAGNVYITVVGYEV